MHGVFARQPQHLRAPRPLSAVIALLFYGHSSNRCFYPVTAPFEAPCEAVSEGTFSDRFSTCPVTASGPMPLMEQNKQALFRMLPSVPNPLYQLVPTCPRMEQHSSICKALCHDIFRAHDADRGTCSHGQLPVSTLFPPLIGQYLHHKMFY